ncbi:hypothetical protein I1A_000715 [Pseudomonas fluorescens R124]|uniref:Uncharacterized protein n=1 Tax=Pseudomonas fluorescens R124 TaxID=743713 RepID=A0A7U9CPM3_PSEFL|nr:hypothetical protein [Pseudomonas fluorescens]EJZ56407.1 hypothetical protein I1A_000715 [Pseudomonas fluorescens R124]
MPTQDPEDYNSTHITGDRAENKRRFGVTLHNMPTVPLSAIIDPKHSINISSESGKRMGALVLAVDEGSELTGRMQLMIAHGSRMNDGWSTIWSSFVEQPQFVPGRAE